VAAVTVSAGHSLRGGVESSRTGVRKEAKQLADKQIEEIGVGCWSENSRVDAAQRSKRLSAMEISIYRWKIEVSTLLPSLSPLRSSPPPWRRKTLYRGLLISSCQPQHRQQQPRLQLPCQSLRLQRSDRSGHTLPTCMHGRSLEGLERIHRSSSRSWTSNQSDSETLEHTKWRWLQVRLAAVLTVHGERAMCG